MRSIFSTILLAAATFSFTAMADFDPKTNTDGQSTAPATDISPRTPVNLGCYSSPGKMFDMGVYTFQSPGWCQALCIRLAQVYFANVNGTNCFCGNTPPAETYKVDNSSCDKTCGGTGEALCGGINFWDVQNGQYQVGDQTGTQKIIIPAPTYTWTPPAAASTSTSSSSSTITAPATIVVTAKASAAPVESQTTTPQQTSSGPNTAAIAAGVVVGIVLLVAIVGGILFFMRRRRQQAMAEEQRRHEMMTNLVTGEKTRSGYASSDSRLDPSLMFQRRLSDGSIRDNEDYSRRILKVANPDD